MRVARSRISGFDVLALASPASSKACSWCGIIICANITSFMSNDDSADCEESVFIGAQPEIPIDIATATASVVKNRCTPREYRHNP